MEYIKGDLFKTDIIPIVHGCNAQGVMGSGVAKIIRDKYPAAYDMYRAQNTYNLGEIIPVFTNGKLIINAITQEYYGRDNKRYVSYDAIAKVFEKLNTFLPEQGYTDLAMPLIGAGLGGGDWNVISEIISSELRKCNAYVYTL